MPLINAWSVGESEIPPNPDLVICASGFESRATHLARKLEGIDCAERVAFGFKDRKILARQRNDRVFSELGYETIESRGSDFRPLVRRLRKALDSGARDIVIDYTSMTRSWYGGLMDYLHRAEMGSTLRVYLSYAPARYSEPKAPSPNRVINPIPGFSHLELPEKPVALILGLGYERDRALGVVEYMDPAEVFVFYTSPALDRRYEEDVRKSNRYLLRRLGARKKVEYPLENLHRTGVLLQSVCTALEDEYRVVVAPLGPKPFGVLGMALSLYLGNLAVWRISGGTEEQPYDREALGRTLNLCMRFG